MDISKVTDDIIWAIKQTGTALKDGVLWCGHQVKVGFDASLPVIKRIANVAISTFTQLVEMTVYFLRTPHGIAAILFSLALVSMDASYDPVYNGDETAKTIKRVALRHVVPTVLTIASTAFVYYGVATTGYVPLI